MLQSWLSVPGWWWTFTVRCWGLVPLAWSGFSGLWRGNSPAGCVLGSGPSDLAWSLGCEKGTVLQDMCWGRVPLTGSGLSWLWRGNSLAGCVWVWSLWPCLDSVGCEEGTVLQDVLESGPSDHVWILLVVKRGQSCRMCWGLVPLTRSGFCSLWRGDSRAGCALGSSPYSQVWSLWAVKREQSCRMCAGV